MNTFFTADQHFFHELMIKEYRKVFHNVEDMNAALIAAWNSVVQPGDRVYCLGDFALGSFTISGIQAIFNALNGQKFLCIGNHDYKNKKVIKDLAWEQVYDVYKLRVGEQHIWLSHYPHLSWPGSFHGSWHLHGHVHGNIANSGKRLDVGVDTVGFVPTSLEQVAERFKNVGLNPDEDLGVVHATESDR